MQLVLLSGGSGKRLWPLSNETRSKQFLRILPTANGGLESMVQRVFRQISEANLNAPVTIATGAAQVDSIKTQVAHNVDIVFEPERRNTFPAIALTCSHLKFDRHCSDDETIIVLPVDPYTEVGFFASLNRMKIALDSNKADLVLLGIKPTYPSEKYGYIVPGQNDMNIVKRVDRFKEKPNLETAKNLIKDGAVWNAGVFAFKLGWLMKILNNYFVPKNYLDVQLNYSKLPMNSFDYEVVEKTNSIMMLEYQGMWKDLGTWNTLCEEMSAENIGKVIIGEKSESTNVVNELGIPVVVLGAKNMVIAASPDGILVSDKPKSSYIKPYVDDLEQRPMYEEKRWGQYTVLDYNEYKDKQKSLTKNLFIKSGKQLSYQKHDKRDEIWTIVDGTGDLLIDGHIRNVKRGDVAYITRGMKHAIRATTDMHIIEVQIGEELIEEDIERLKFDW